MKNPLSHQHHHAWHHHQGWRHALYVVEFDLRGFENVLSRKVSNQGFFSSLH